MAGPCALPMACPCGKELRGQTEGCLARPVHEDRANSSQNIQSRHIYIQLDFIAVNNSIMEHAQSYSAAILGLC
jgi:hypothetical protein